MASAHAGKACPLCGNSMDVYGDHAVVCVKNHLWRRHFLIQDFLLRLIRAAGFQVTREESLAGSDRREADLLIQNWEGVTPLAIDITIRHPRAPSAPLSDPDAVLLRAEEEKRTGAAARADRAGTLFEPLVFHTWGGAGKDGELPRPFRANSSAHRRQSPRFG